MNSIATYIVFGLSITLVCAGKSNDDPCKANPCANRGVCLPIFTCDCQDGYAGDTCNQVVASPCKPNPCKNGGVCKKNGGSYTCICAAGYEGSNCQTSTDPCSSSPCLNGGKCKTKGSAFTCSCADGYSGSNCNKFDPCYSSPCLNGGECSVQKGTFTCSCADGFSGKNCNVVDKLADCSDALKSGKKSEGVYPIKLSSGNTVAAYCEDGGWLRIMRRQDGSVDFNRGWADYSNGFGDPKGEFWLGNENVYQIVSGSGRAYSLRVDVTYFDGVSEYALYSKFSLGSAATFYTINVGGYSGTLSDIFNVRFSGDATVTNGMKFTTFDADHDNYWGNCAKLYPGGWWYNSCWGTMLTGKYATGNVCPSNCGSDCYCQCSQVCYKFKMIKYATMRLLPKDTSSAYTDCRDAMKAGKKADGVYDIKLPSGDVVSAYCEMSSGGWMRFLRREDGSVEFKQNWNQYTNGFGSALGEHWLGNENVYQIMSNGRSYTLRIDITWWDGTSGYAQYSSFSLAPGSNFYRLNVGGYSGTIGDVFAIKFKGQNTDNNGNAFTTFDSDHDNYWGNCAVAYPGGWWYNSCWGMVLTGKYATNGNCPAACGSDCYCQCSQVCNVFKMIKYATMKFMPIGA